MQWILMLAGLLLGAASDESLSGAIFGGLIGLALGQALKVRALEFEQSALRKDLQAFAERFEQGTAAIHQRLLKVEEGVVAPPAVSPVPAEPAPPASAAAQVADDSVWPLPESASNIVPDDSELIWELPALEPAAAQRDYRSQAWVATAQPAASQAAERQPHTHTS
jgi:hypothetical protein